MKVKQIEVHYKESLSLEIIDGRWQGVDAGLTYMVEIEDGDVPEEAVAEARVAVIAQVQEQVKARFQEFTELQKQLAVPVAKPTPQLPTTHSVDQNYPPADGSLPDGWIRTEKGKLLLKLQANEAEPNEVECPIHPGEKMKRRTNDKGSWLSHKHDEIWCSANFARE